MSFSISHTMSAPRRTRFFAKFALVAVTAKNTLKNQLIRTKGKGPEACPKNNDPSFGKPVLNTQQQVQDALPGDDGLKNIAPFSTRTCFSKAADKESLTPF